MSIEAKITPRKALVTLLATVVINTIIAVFLTGIGFGGGIFQINLIYSQSIGLAICTSVMAIHALFSQITGWKLICLQTVGIFFGSLCGLIVGGLFYGKGTPGHLDETIEYHQAMVVGLLFGAIVSFFFLARERLSESKSLADQERIRRLISENKETETHLKLLHAQIEPHFLFNTLSNILSLLETDLDRGKQMLTDLTTYLRTSLARSRERISTLGDEIDSISAYINIFSIRLGDRLTVEIDVPEKLRHHKFPPMLLQPLVENALLHGIDPKIEGGRLRIAAESDNGRLRLEVADTGIGLTDMPAKNGVGITNTRERLNGLYGEKGILRITENQPSGLKIYIEVPGETDSRDNR